MAELIENETFTDVDAARFAGRDLYRCAFRGVKWAEARLERCKLERCTFEDCDLTRTALVGVSLRGVVFKECKLLGVDFAKLDDNPEVSFERCILRFANFAAVNLRGATLESCELQEARFFEASLVDVDFAGSDLAGASISRCDLAGADFSHAAHVFLDPRVNNAKGCLVAVDTAVMMAHALGVRVAGYGDPSAGKKRR